ncbi:hypothetical protein MCOR27_006594 [Pyricularia oryzae]|uniref:Uncharacterized protein n=1 Tax=Pyricularia grisea TaxID=148305 RepID=A0ABQ8NI65_PYRGI|nr:hypothetical protein MCOR01_001566 [Pyricularia oryzae]KAI6297052.1 hypothetical protein MCOR33_006508 [Pyricularia grisea]KAI6257849.1 hypothetical protein MCOR19_005723 [Pyricularia oryzae]KAI6274823.1 hypothetical protein MCOR26_006278 [Pyricularia oryzae]KAI6276224.1 hypothetical protein MCOR27_006594 [Pyricularia oryzae]
MAASKKKEPRTDLYIRVVRSSDVLELPELVDLELDDALFIPEQDADDDNLGIHQRIEAIDGVLRRQAQSHPLEVSSAARPRTAKSQLLSLRAVPLEPFLVEIMENTARLTSIKGEKDAQ